MAQARRRIILVGDHRQLPHMIDEEIARTLEAREAPADGERAAEREESYIRRSMFQYLLSRLKQLQARDQFKRWVTLDQQFRMHRLLGQFVSDHFYREHGEAFDSPLADDQFAHGRPGLPDVPAVWIDVPAGWRGEEEERVGTSCRRTPEARAIAAWLARWIDSPAGRRLTFGVISFYKAQVAEVFQALSDRRYTKRDEAGQWRIAEAYMHRPAEEKLPPEERLRIGSVDAFQGMEFDVVFLSMVRSRRDLPAAPADPVRLEREIYGHLTSPNRLCVSMSRQKQLLVVVGDKAMVEHPLAGRAVPGLVGFLKLCQAHGVVLGAGD
jgi:superfamily I DNA and/or RNA helicase